MPGTHELATTETQDARSVGAVAAASREQTELQAAFTMAAARPRNEIEAFDRLVKSCERLSFAESAYYSYPRGNKQIEGPTVNLAREAARVWGNLRYGFRVVEMDEDWIHIQGMSLDLETNVFVCIEDKFKRLIFRKKGGWKKPDERDLRELMNRRGAILERNALLKVLPSDLIEDAMGRARETLVKAARGDIQQSREEAIRSIVKALGDFAVSIEMLERYIGHPLIDLDGEELANLRNIWKSIYDGNSTRGEHFEMAKPEETSGSAMSGSVSLESLKAGKAPEPKDQKEKKGRKGSKKKTPARKPQEAAEAPPPDEGRSGRAEGGDGQGEGDPAADTPKESDGDDLWTKIDEFAQQMTPEQLEQILEGLDARVTDEGLAMPDENLDEALSRLREWYKGAEGQQGMFK